MRSSRVGGKGDHGCVDDPTEKIGSARERDVQVDGWMKGRRADGMKGSLGVAVVLLHPATPPTSLLPPPHPSLSLLLLLSVSLSCTPSP